MILAILRAAARTDRWLRRKLGRPYGVLLTVGLFIELIRRLAELPEKAGEAHRLAPLLLVLALNLALLIHQAGELSEKLRPRDRED